MTDQTVPKATNEERTLARKWAESIESRTETWTACTRAAARVILDTVPAPSPPTLADMTDEERTACRWMQCDYAWITRDTQDRGVIGYFDHREKKAVILTTTSGIVRRGYDRVTPRPDLPRMEWPGDQKPAPAPALPDGWRLADHPDLGRVIVTTTPDRYGNVYVVIPDAGDFRGYDWLFCDPAELTYIDQEADTADTVPPNTLAVGSVWDDAGALAEACREYGRDQIAVTDKRGGVGVWDTGMRCWRVTAPHADFAPYTVIHAGKEADQ